MEKKVIIIIIMIMIIIIIIISLKEIAALTRNLLKRS